MQVDEMTQLPQWFIEGRIQYVMTFLSGMNQNNDQNDLASPLYLGFHRPSVQLWATGQHRGDGTVADRHDRDASSKQGPRSSLHAHLPWKHQLPEEPHLHLDEVRPQRGRHRHNFVHLVQCYKLFFLFTKGENKLEHFSGAGRIFTEQGAYSQHFISFITYEQVQ